MSKGPVMNGVPLVSVLGLVPCTIFFGDMDSGIKYSLNQLAHNTKLAGTANTHKRRDAIQKELDRLERWACANLLKFNKAKCKVLHLGWENSQYQNRQGAELIESSPVEKDLDVFVDEKLNTTHQRVLAAQKANSILGCIKSSHGQQPKGIDSASLLHSCDSPAGVGATSGSGALHTRT